MNKIEWEISWVGLWRIFFFGLIVYAMFLGGHVLLALFLALILSSGLEVAVSFLEKRRVPRILGTILVFLVFALTVTAIFYTIIPLLIINLNNFLADATKSTSQLWQQLKVPNSFYSIQQLNALVNQLVTSFFSGSVAPISFVSNLFGGIVLAFSVFIISFYLSLSRSGVENFIKIIFPSGYEDAALKVYERSRRKIGHWFGAQIILSLMMGFLVWFALFLLGVKYPVLLGTTAGILELVPFVGPISAGALSVFIALTTSLPLAIYTLITFLALQQLESNVLVPLLMRRAVGLHPVIVIVSLLIGIEISGAIGAVVAIPVAAILQEMVEEWGNKKEARRAGNSL